MSAGVFTTCPALGAGIGFLAANPVGLTILGVGAVAGDEEVPFVSYSLSTPLEFQEQYHELNFCCVEKCSWAVASVAALGDQNDTYSTFARLLSAEWSMLAPLLLSFGSLAAGMGKRMQENKEKLAKNRSLLMIFLVFCMVLAMVEFGGFV